MRPALSTTTLSIDRSSWPNTVMRNSSPVPRRYSSSALAGAGADKTLSELEEQAAAKQLSHRNAASSHSTLPRTIDSLLAKTRKA